MRLAIESSAVGLFAAWYIGDVSALLAGVPAALSQARYSRGFEREADDFAARLLVLNGIPVGRLADILERMDGPPEPLEGGSRTGSEHSRSPFAYFATHPLTAERIHRLRAAP